MQTKGVCDQETPTYGVFVDPIVNVYVLKQQLKSKIRIFFLTQSRPLPKLFYLMLRKIWNQPYDNNIYIAIDRAREV